MTPVSGFPTVLSSFSCKVKKKALEAQLSNDLHYKSSQEVLQRDLFSHPLSGVRFKQT